MTQTSWVGALEIGEGWQFVEIHRGTADGDGLAETLADLPELGVYRVPVDVAGPSDRLALTVQLDGAQLTFDGVRSDGLAEGEVNTAKGKGRFRLWPLAQADADAFRLHSCDHVSVTGRALSFHQISDLVTDEPVFLCTENDRITRLHPVSDTEFLSEQAELFALTDTCVVTADAGDTRSDEETLLSHEHTWSEEDVEFFNGDIKLAGTIMRPHGTGRIPAVVLLHAAGGGKRDFYRIFGAAFAKAGIAALIFDKRGTGGSTGDPITSLRDRSVDAEAGLSYLQSRADVDAASVGVWGFSNGGWSAAMLAARRPDAAFLILVGAAGVSPAESEVHRKAFELREHGVPEEEVAAVADVWRLIYSYFVTRDWASGEAERFDELAAFVASSSALAAIRPQAYTNVNPILSPLPPFNTRAELEGAVAAIPVGNAEELSYDPVEAFGALHCPVLMLLGEQDGNVPADLSARRTAAALEAAGNARATIRVLPGAGHMLNVVQPISGLTSEEAVIGFRRFRFAPGALELMVDWVHDEAVTGDLVNNV